PVILRRMRRRPDACDFDALWCRHYRTLHNQEAFALGDAGTALRFLREPPSPTPNSRAISASLLLSSVDSSPRAFMTWLISSKASSRVAASGGSMAGIAASA